MTILRTEGQIVGAANAAQALTNLVVAYLLLYKKHAQGLNGVHVPDGPFTVVFMPIRQEGVLPFKIVYTKTETWSTPDYYDVDDDMFDERLGASNISGYTTDSVSYTEEGNYSIAFASLLRPQNLMEQDVIAFAERKRAAQREQARLNAIAEHEAAIAELKSQRH